MPAVQHKAFKRSETGCSFNMHNQIWNMIFWHLILRSAKCVFALYAFTGLRVSESQLLCFQWRVINRTCKSNCGIDVAPDRMLSTSQCEELSTNVRPQLCMRTPNCIYLYPYMTLWNFHYHLSVVA